MTKMNMTFKGILLEQELMSAHTSWRVGGIADHFIARKILMTFRCI